MIRTSRLASHGWAGVLGTSPHSSWLGDGRLQINGYELPERDLSRARELDFVPVHGYTRLGYAGTSPRNALADTGSARASADGLARLIGPNRARVLRLRDEPWSTIQLAALTGLPPGAVTNHLGGGSVTSLAWRVRCCAVMAGPAPADPSGGLDGLLTGDAGWCGEVTGGGLVTQPDEDLVRAATAAFGRGDLGALQDQFFAADIVWHIAGTGPLAGDYQGAAQVMGLLAEISELSGGTVRTELRDVSDDRTVVFTAIRAERAGKQLQLNLVHVIHAENGKATEVWTQSSDPAAAAEFWS